MRILVAALILAACSHPAPPMTPACPAVVEHPAPVAAKPQPQPLDDAQVIAQAEAFLGALDRNDAPAFAAAISPAFVNVGNLRTYDAKYLTASVQGRADNKFPIRTRACTNTRVFRGPITAVYTSACVVKFPAHDDVPAFDETTYDSVVLAAEDAGWKVVTWRFTVIGPDTEREQWNDTFRMALNFKHTANQHLIDAVKGKKPGKALDIAMGQGRNVLYLASQKWDVTGVDISDVGINQALESARKQKLVFKPVVEDIAKYDLGKDRWDLVTLIYAGNDPKLIERIKPSIKQGGLFVLEFFHKEATAGTGIGGFATGELATAFAGWTIITDEVVEDVADWGLRKSKVVRFTAQRP